jgi:hypothetical protein
LFFGGYMLPHTIGLAISLPFHAPGFARLVSHSVSGGGVLAAAVFYQRLRQSSNLHRISDHGLAVIENRLLPRNYWLARLFFRLAFYLQSVGKQPLVVFQMGKVGSKTVEWSLKAAHLPNPVYHAHILCPSSIKNEEIWHYGKRPGILDRAHLPEARHLFTSYCLRERIDAGGLSETKRWKVVTLVRDPVARNISGFFEDITVRIPNFYRRFREDSLTIEELIETFLQEYAQHNVPLKWFDSELNPVFAIDVYSSEFPKARGYKIYEGKYADVLLLRLENLNACYRVGFKEFLNLEDLTLIPGNKSSGKEYFPAYAQFMTSVVLPDSYLDRMYNSKYATHFYTQDEIDAFRRRWSRK